MLGDNIRKIRNAKDLTLDQLAEKIESTSGTLSHIEKGTRNPSLGMLNKIADALGVSALELMAGDSQAENAYFNEINRMAFPGNTENVTKHLDRDITNTVEWGTAELKDQTASKVNEASTIYSIDDFEPVSFRFIKVPVLGKIPAGLPVEARENIIDYINVPENELHSESTYFYLQVDGDSMINSGIKNGYRVLVKRQPDVESGEIAVVRVNSHDATLKRVKKIDGQVILYPDNPAYDPIFIREEGAEIIGKVVKVEFDPNKKY